MFKSIFRETIAVLLKYPKILRLWAFGLISFSLVRIYSVVYYINNLLLQKYESGLDLSDALLYLIDSIGMGKQLILLVVVIILIVIGYLWLYPIAQSGVVFALEKKEKSAFSSFVKGGSRFFPMLEYNGLSISFGIFVFLTVLLRLFIMDILWSGLIIVLISIWWLAVFFALFFWPYARILIVLEGISVFDAIKRSVVLTFSNLALTFQLVIFEVILLLRFILNALLVIGVPLLFIYLAFALNIIQYSIVETIIWVITILLIIFLAYINSLIETFFLTYWYTAYQKIIHEEE